MLATDLSAAEIGHGITKEHSFHYYLLYYSHFLGPFLCNKLMGVGGGTSKIRLRMHGSKSDNVTQLHHSMLHPATKLFATVDKSPVFIHQSSLSDNE